MFLKESLYGWGVCNIPMPRATLDILWDRRKKRARISSLEKRRQSERPGILAAISGVLVHDVPWFQTLVLSIFALLSITFIFLMSRMVPEFPEKEILEPVDIMIRLIEDTAKRTSALVHETPQPISKDNIIKERVLSKKSEEKAKAIPEPKPSFEIKRNPLPVLKRESVSEEILPDIRIHPRIRRKPLKSTETYLPKDSTFEKMMQSEDVNLSVSAGRNRKYNINSVDRTQRKVNLRQSDYKTSFISKRSNEQAAVDFPARRSQRKYKLDTEDRTMIVPFGKTDLSSESPNIQIATDFSSKLSKKNYRLETKVRGMIAFSDKSDSILKHPNVPVAAISPVKHSRKNYRSDVEDRGTMVLSDKTDSLLTYPDVSDVTVSSANFSEKKYKARIENHSTIVHSDKANSLLTHPDVSAATVSPVVRAQKNYTVDTKEQGDSIPSIKTDPLLIHPDVLAATVAPLKNSQKIYQGDRSDSEKNMISENESLSFENITIDDIDPSHLISLKELAVCADPEEEFYLKTKLATFLSGPAKCESKGLMLFFKYTESGYTIRVDIYNPRGVFLKDRCSVLHSAVGCVQDKKEKGVIP